MEKWIKVLLFVLVLAIIAILFIFAPNFFDLINKPTKIKSTHGYDLGGNCLAHGDGIMNLPDLWDQLEAAEKLGKYEKAIEINKKIIRRGCDNEYFWAGLPALHLKNNDFQGAMAALETMYAKKFMVVETFFDPSEAKDYFKDDEIAYKLFQKLKESNEFINSNLAKEMLENRINHRQRIKDALDKLNNLKESDKPPKLYVTKGAEAFRPHGPYPPIEELIVKINTEIFESPAGTKITGQALKGNKVKMLSGETHVEPKPLVILDDFQFSDRNVVLKKGDIIFKLDCPGEEGACRYWKGGHEFIEEIVTYKYIPFKDNRVAYAEYIFPEQADINAISWIKIKLPNGAQGWTKQIDNFQSVSEDAS